MEQALMKTPLMKVEHLRFLFNYFHLFPVFLLVGKFHIRFLYTSVSSSGYLTKLKHLIILAVHTIHTTLLQFLSLIMHYV